ncbi:Kelch repeat-containing protein [Cavenderia fasciculata]|uniref:Kelch repeat-containing protein n=1 Tax=Cavenderia fasciculata TaxID=261658 RepID=F4PX99_CACFS|nr:Kelch repeat-containing protein [Cavenderia fasciculata]EGG19902.1 Kelch repeat-containing protein [Cavenderia fasciculata]|eukprot:XP_004366885.1 Kelch repeat-containing protein [Cavenderia fasciculata]
MKRITRLLNVLAKAKANPNPRNQKDPTFCFKLVKLLDSFSKILKKVFPPQHHQQQQQQQSQQLDQHLQFEKLNNSTTTMELFNSMELNLPYEVILYIFSYLKLNDICELRLVSKTFNKICSEYSLWRTFIIKLSTATKPPPRVCHTAVVYNHNMYVYGGHLPDSHTFIKDVKSDLHEFNFDKRKWVKKITKGTPLPEKTEHSSVVYKDSMYIFGGYSGPQTYLDVSIYKLNLDSLEGSIIETKGDILPQGRSAHCSIVWEHYMYIFGGWDGTESNNSFFRFNFLNSEWQRVPSRGTPPPCIRSHSCVLYDHFMYIIGGYGPEGHTQYPYCYDLLSDEWISMAHNKDGPCSRSRLRSVVYDNHIWCLGGWDRSNYYNDLWKFNLETRTWSKIYSDFELSGIGQYSLVTHKNNLYIYGGYNPNTCSPQPNLYTYMVGHPQLHDNEIMSLEKIYDDNDEMIIDDEENEDEIEIEMEKQEEEEKQLQPSQQPSSSTLFDIEMSDSTNNNNSNNNEIKNNNIQVEQQEIILPSTS